MHVIALIENEAGLRDSLELVLKNEGYEVYAFAEGKQFLDTLGDAHFDLVITNIVLPDIDGWTLSHLIRANPNTAAAPIIGMTLLEGYAHLHTRDDELPWDVILHLPIDVETFVALVRSCLTPSRPTRP